MPTIRRCCIIGCISNSRQNPQLQFFQFPRPENPFHSLWKQACHASLSRILPFKKPVVCALHFHPNNIGGRRLISSAVPSMRLEVPTNLKAVEQQAMVEEIERSRKCAYINAVVYEWLVRANLNPQLRGSITHGMIKEKAETAKQVIGAPSFIADNRWLNRFRETHLTGFAHKLATNQLRPSGPSLWIPDIVADLQHLFPPTSASADRTINFENVPEQYYDYMQQQYGEYEDDEEDQPSPQQHPQQSPQHHLQQQQQQQHQHQQQQQHQHQQQPSPHPHAHPHHMQQPSPPQDAYEQHNYNYDDFYYERHHSTESYSNLQQRPPSISTPQQHQQQRAKSVSPYPNPVKRPRSEEGDVTVVNGATEHIEDLTEEPHPEALPDKGNPKDCSNGNGTATPTNGHSSPKYTNGNANNNVAATNGHSSPAPPTADLRNYTQALEYLRPLEDFALFKENFRAIGLISQLEVILRIGERTMRENNEN